MNSFSLPLKTETLSLSNNRPAFEKKIITRELLQIYRFDMVAPVVMTNGCFDILHRGHVSYLAAAKALGHTLIVAVNSDQSVMRQEKGDERPIHCLEDRLAMLASLESVDWVVSFEEETPQNLITELRPDMLVKAADWAIEEIIGSREVASWGGQTLTIPIIHHTSTTTIIEKIRSVYL